MSDDGTYPDDDCEPDEFDEMLDRVRSFDDFVPFLDELMDLIRESDELYQERIINYIAQMRSNLIYAKAVAKSRPQGGPAYPEELTWQDVAGLLLQAALEI